MRYYAEGVALARGLEDYQLNYEAAATAEKQRQATFLRDIVATMYFRLAAVIVGGCWVVDLVLVKN